MSANSRAKICPTEQLVLYHYGELEERDSLFIENHLQQCTACRAELSSLQDVLNKIPTTMPELTKNDLNNFNSRVMQKLPHRNFFSRPVLSWGITATVILILTFSLQQPGETPVNLTAEQEVLNNLEMLQNLDLLENLDLLQQLASLG